jgi:hypothetical protein
MTELAHLAARRSGFRNRRQGLLLGAALGVVLGTVLPAGRADAQTSGGFQGTPSFDPAKVDIVRGANTDTITLKAPVATINWTPTDNQGTGPINFLPQGNTGIFQNDGTTTSNFAVLNRIVPADTTRRVDFNGRVISQLRDAAGNVTGPGGSVAFYSPGGIFISSTAVFDIGSLLLTTLDPVRDGSGNFFGASGNITLVGAPDGTSSVITAAGSQINALANGSYVGLVAPRVEHNGSIRVNGSAGLIAAEAVDLTIADGLFNIVIQTGTPVADAITSNGSIGGPASTGGTDNHIIYAVAVPKNQAITTILRGQIGFDAATSATVENGEIILSAGYNVNGRTIATSPVAGSLGASAVLDSGSYTSDVRARAVTDASVRTLSSNASFAGDATLIGSQRAFIAAENGRTISIMGTAAVSNARGDTFGADPAGSGSGSVPIFGSEATIQANGGGSFVDIRGNAIAEALVRGVAAGPATGGRAEIFAANGGRVDVAGTVDITATGAAGRTTTGENGADATGGRAAVQASSGGTITLGGAVNISANGRAGVRRGGAATDPSGTGTGGTATVEAFGAGSVVTLGGPAIVAADGFGSNTVVAGNGGTGIGGSATLSATSGGRLNLNGTGQGSVTATGNGGTVSDAGQAGGEGTGGVAQVFVSTGGIVNSTQGLSIRASGLGSNGIAGDGGRGRGGTAVVQAAGTGSSITIQAASISGAGIGGSSTGGTGGAGTGGQARILAQTDAQISIAQQLPILGRRPRHRFRRVVGKRSGRRGAGRRRQCRRRRYRRNPLRPRPFRRRCIADRRGDLIRCEPRLGAWFRRRGAHRGRPGRIRPGRHDRVWRERCRQHAGGERVES